MKYIVTLTAVAMISACGTTAPVVAKFPEAPGKGAMRACVDLKKLPDETRLSEVARTVNDNYGSYWECAVKVDTWIEWYEIQRRIFEGIK